MKYNEYSSENNYNFTEKIIELKPNDTYNSLFSRKENIDNTKILNNPLYKQLKELYKKVFQTGREYGLSDGEIQMLIHLYSDGKPLHDIEKRRIEDLIYFIHTNVDKLHSFIDPELHAFLLRTKYYKKNKEEQPKKHRCSRIARIIKFLIRQNNSAEKLKKFSEILSRL